MQRITITIDDDLAEKLDAFRTGLGAENRSEAIRELIRRGLGTGTDAPVDARTLGVLSCTIDQSIRTLAMRIPQTRLERHNQTLTALSVPLDHTTSLEIAVMRGKVSDVVSAAETLFLERGVLHGTLALIPIIEEDQIHSHADGAPDVHTHTTVQASF